MKGDPLGLDVEGEIVSGGPLLNNIKQLWSQGVAKHNIVIAAHGCHLSRHLHT